MGKSVALHLERYTLPLLLECRCYNCKPWSTAFTMHGATSIWHSAHQRTGLVRKHTWGLPGEHNLLAFSVQSLMHSCRLMSCGGITIHVSHIKNAFYSPSLPQNHALGDLLQILCWNPHALFRFGPGSPSVSLWCITHSIPRPCLKNRRSWRAYW